MSRRYRSIIEETKRTIKDADEKINTYDRISDYQNDIRKTWKSLRNIIGTQNDKSNISQIFTVNKKK